MIKIKDNYLNILTYILIFSVFMGSNFLKFEIMGMRFNIARIFMIVTTIISLYTIVKTKKICDFKNNFTKFYFLFFVIWSIWSIFSIFKTLDLKNYFIMLFYIVVGTGNILYFCQHVDLKKNYNIFLNLVNFSVFINCLYYIYLFYFQNRNIGGFYHNSNDLATVLLFTIPSAIFMFINSKSSKMKLVNSVYLLVYLYSFVSIFSRACLLGFFMSCILLVAVLMVKFRDKIFKSKKNIIMLFIFLAIFVLAFIYIISHYVGKVRLKPVENARTSKEIRTNLILNSFHFLSQDGNLFLGIGAGNSKYYLKNYSIYSTHNIYNFHNFWLDLIVEYGIFIFLGFIYLYICLCKKLYDNIPRENINTMDLIMLFFLFAFVIASISSSTIITREWLWLVFGIIMTYLDYEYMKKIK